MIKQDCVDRILDQVNMLDVLQEHTTLKRAGASWKGCCPFHDEKTASFIYSPAKDIYKCFGCGEGGVNAAQFLVAKGKTFPEAMEQLAARTGIQLEYEQGSSYNNSIKLYHYKQKVSAQLTEVMDDAHKLLRDQSKPLSHYEGKDWSSETIDTLGICVVNGGSPLSKSDLDKELLKEAGLLGEKNKRVYDTFFKHIMYPIHDAKGEHVISYTSRSIGWKEGDEWGKWRNGKETAIYNKSEVLYGYHLACLPPRDENGNIPKDENGRPMKSPVDIAGYCYLVEGAPNVAILKQIGVHNVVATCGTALTHQQAKLLAQATDKVCIIPDNDTAGYNSIYTSTEQLTKAQVFTEVLPFPDDIARGVDIYDYITEQDMEDVEDFQRYYDTYVMDAILYCTVHTITKESNQFDKEVKAKIAIRYLSHITTKTIQEGYVSQISKRLGMPLATFRDGIKDLKSNESDNKLSVVQLEDKTHYGIWEKGNLTLNRNDTVVANFTVGCPYLIKEEEKAYRVIDIKNYKGVQTVTQLPQKTFSSLSDFKTSVEGFGNYIFRGNADDYINMRERVYDKTVTAKHIQILGYHQSSGCYIYSNGLVQPDGVFVPVNQYGIVEYGDHRFFLPTYSSIKNDAEDSMRTDNFELAFSYPEDINLPKGCPSNIDEFGAEWLALWGDRGIVPYCFYFASLYRDIVADGFGGVFPFLHLYGQTSLGKSHMAYQLSNMFHKHVPATDCNSSTDAAFYRLPMLGFNFIVCYEELSSELEENRKKFLKNIWDGIARAIADRDSEHKIRQQQIRAAAITMGQTFPSNDPAFVNRALTETIQDKTTSEDILKRSDLLKDWSMDGLLVPITASLHARRDEFRKLYLDAIDKAKYILKTKTSHIKVNSRIVNNYAQMLATYSAVDQMVKTPYDLAHVLDVMIDRILNQVKYTVGADELTHWWDEIEHLISKKQIAEDYHCVSHEKTITVESGTKVFSDYKKILYININYAYKEYASSKSIKRVDTKPTIVSYLKQSVAYLGIKKAKKLSGHTQRCYVFDADLLPGQYLLYTGNDAQYNDQGIEDDKDKENLPF